MQEAPIGHTNVVNIRHGKVKEQPLDAATILAREEIAAQIVALMQAKFTRPGPEEMLAILHCAELQVTALLPPAPPS